MVQHVVSWLTETPRRLRRLDPAIKADSVVAPGAVQVDRALNALAIAAVLLAIGHYAATLGWSRAAIADFHPLNGDFQNFNPVKRLFLGQHAGADFDSYLGLGPIHLVTAAMCPLGQDFATSLFVTHFLHAIAMAASVWLLCRLCGLPGFGSCLLGWAALVYARNTAYFFPRFDFLHETFSELVQPGNSALGLRCLAPLIAAFAMLPVVRCSPNARVAGALLGAIAGALLPWSNDHGLPMAMSLIFVGGLWICETSGPNVRTLQGLVLMPIAMALIAGLVLLAATAGNPQEWFAYNFLNVAKDQFWYFVGPTSKVTTIYDIPWYRGALVALVVLGALAVKIRRHKRPEDYVLAFLVLSNLLAGYLSITGSRGERYFFPLYRCLAIVVPYLVWSVCASLLKQRLAASVHATLARQGKQLAALAAGAVLACALLGSQGHYAEARQRRHAAIGALDVPELGGKLGHHFSKVIAVGRDIRAQAESAGVPAHQRLFSTYATAMDVVAGAPHAARSDYIIHALGPQRRVDYVRQLIDAKPLFVTTIRDDFTPWEGWLRAVSWDFYAELLKTYQPVDRTLYNVVWERRNEPAVWPDVSLPTTITQGADSDAQLAVHFPSAAGVANERYLIEVEIEYDWSWKPFHVVRGALRPYLFARDAARPEGWGLPAYETTRRFPVELAPGETSVVSLAALPLDSTKFSVRRATARLLLPKSHIDGFALTRLRASSLCDENWTNGVWTRDSRAAFFVADYSDLRDLRPGSRLRFSASGERVVEQLTADQVWLQGPPLKPAEDGFPHAIEILAR